MSKGVLRVAAAQYPIERLPEWSAYETKLRAIAAAAAAGGAGLLVLPEYGAMELTGLLPEEVQPDLAATIAAMQAFDGPFGALFAGLAVAERLHVLAPSFPVRVGAAYRNRARLFGPDGAHGFQDKLQMTRFERERWGISGGDALKVFDTALGRIGVAVCYDVEFPLIVRRQVEAGADLILAPSCTDTLAGYHRVRVGAQARALENQCFVVQSPTVGEAAWSPAVDVNIGAAGAFGPIDVELSDDGVLTLGELNRPGLVFADLDFAKLAAVRRDGEVFNSADWGGQAAVGEAVVESLAG